MARDLRGFIKQLEQRGQLRRITAPVDPNLEISEIANRLLQSGGPGLLFENVKGSPYPVAVNLMGTVERVYEYGITPGIRSIREKISAALST
jgi:4-hydroxy-3-polyprenylbenzoate decarboxylase